jgi:hypothetical protein
MTMSGHEFEHHVAAIFRRQGWQAKVTPGSGDYGVDIVLTRRDAESGETRVAVQVKMFSAPVGPQAVQEVVAGKAVHRCSEAWVVTNSTFTPAAARLAAANGVRLIAGIELRGMEARAQRAEERVHEAATTSEKRWQDREKPSARELSVSWIASVLLMLYLLVAGGGLVSLLSGRLDPDRTPTIIALIVLPAALSLVVLAIRFVRRRTTDRDTGITAEHPTASREQFLQSHPRGAATTDETPYLRAEDVIE